jgi:hypothetical protein
MSDTAIDRIRAEFEAWVKSRSIRDDGCAVLRGSCGQGAYLSVTTRFFWEAWRAAYLAGMERLESAPVTHYAGPSD